MISILTHLRKLLHGCDIVIYTDSLYLSYLQTSQSRKLQRYHVEIVDFHPKIVHISGKSNGVADFLSRMDFNKSFLDSYSIELFPLSPRYVAIKQMKDEVLQSRIVRLKEGRCTESELKKYELKFIEKEKVLCYKNTTQMIIPGSIQVELL